MDNGTRMFSCEQNDAHTVNSKLIKFRPWKTTKFVLNNFSTCRCYIPQWPEGAHLEDPLRPKIPLFGHGPGSRAAPRAFLAQSGRWPFSRPLYSIRKPVSPNICHIRTDIWTDFEIVSESGSPSPTKCVPNASFGPLCIDQILRGK